ncbi:MAG: Holliday junction branch migration protein RuvA [bacterium]|nr:Holliday junction branch migration protein RuvA [bacterium]
MLAYLRGQVLAKGNNYVILDVNNVGYQIFAGESLLGSIKIAEDREFYLSHIVREDASDLYGFRNVEELEMFGLLLSVSGVGPKSALGVMSIATVDDVREAVLRGDAELLTKVAGIGKKTAERVVLELKNKVGKIMSGGSLGAPSMSTSYGDELDALIALGYSMQDARAALNEVDTTLTDSGERVKTALKRLGKRI